MELPKFPTGCSLIITVFSLLANPATSLPYGAYMQYSGILTIMAKIFGVQFAPLFVPTHRRMETFCAMLYILIMGFGGFFGYVIVFGCLLFTNTFRFAALMYLFWWWYDYDSANNGRRFSYRTRDLMMYKHFARYFPITVVSTADLTADDSYLFIYVPHGIIPVGAVGGLSTNGCGFDQKFPGIKMFSSIATYIANSPLTREWGSLLGGVSSSESALLNILGKKGQAAVLVAGGAAECLLTKSGTYRTLVGRRRGFVRVALKAGAALVPTISFGENEVYGVLSPAKGTFLGKIQELAKALTGFVPLLFTGRGFFQYTFGFLPRRRPVNVVVGAPIKLPKIENPSKDQIETWHRTFCKELKDLFEREKLKYHSENPSIQLEFV